MTRGFVPVSVLVRAAGIKPAMRRRVALVLAAVQDREGRSFPVSLGLRAELVGLPADEIRCHVQSLVAQGVLEMTSRPDCRSPAPLAGYQFNEMRLRLLADQHVRTEDLFGDWPPPRMPFLATDGDGASQLMAVELHGLPGQRTVHFFLEAPEGDIPYGWGYLSGLLLPAFAKGAWTGALNPQAGAPAWARAVTTHPETMSELRQWAQVMALGRPEGMTDLTPIEKHSQKQKGTADGH